MKNKHLDFTKPLLIFLAGFMLLITIATTLVFGAETMMKLLAGEGKLKNVPPANENVLEGWRAAVNPVGVKPGTVLEQANLGSHHVVVSVPKMDKGMRKILKEGDMSVLEVYYERGSGRLEPAFAEEPDASAVYYFYNAEDLDDAAIVSWDDTGHEQMLCWGTGLDLPYIMKIMVYCTPDDTGVAQSLYIEDQLGTGHATVVDDIKDVHFGEASLKMANGKIFGQEPIEQ